MQPLNSLVQPVKMALHKPVLTSVVTELLLEGERRLFIDCTIGGGAHAAALLNASERSIRIFALDKDPAALKLAAERLSGYKDVTILQGDYASLDEIAVEWSIIEVDGIFADFGQSSDQLEDHERGFSHRFDGPLDMRYDNRSGLTATEIVNEYSKSELTEIFRRYGQERQASRIAAAIIRKRPVYRTGQLADLIRRNSSGAFIEKTLARVFMALRTEVNSELNAIAKLLPRAFTLLKQDGRMVLISYDSNQDRIVKDFFRLKSRPCTCPPSLPVCVCGARPELKILTPHVIKPDKVEIDINPRSRSAKLRAAEKIPYNNEEAVKTH